jgi:hypothetical protein
MVSDIPPVGITQNERFLSCDTVLLAVRYMHTSKQISQLLVKTLILKTQTATGKKVTAVHRLTEAHLLHFLKHTPIYTASSKV